MGNPFRDLGVSDAELNRAIEQSAESLAERRKLAREAQAYARSIAPKRTGAYAAGIEVQVTKSRKVRVVATHWTSHFIEYGTKADTKQGSKFGPDTPTPEFAVMARTALHFGGTTDGQLGIGEAA